MKIVIDLTSLNDNFSGIERYALNISLNLIKQDKINNYILLFKNKIYPDFKEFIDNKNIEIKIINGKNKLFFNQIKLLFELIKIKADKYLFLAFPSPILFRKKGIINTVHDLTAFLYPDTMKKSSMLYFKYSIINAIKVSEKIITVSNASKKDISNYFNIYNIFVVGNGISDVFINFKYSKVVDSQVRNKYSLPDNYIMSLGTIEPRKNLTLLIRAFSQLKNEKKIDHKLVVVGRKGWKIDKIFNEIDNKNIINDIIFTGFVEDEYLPYIYNNSDLFIFPSIYEGFGIPPLEAMYLGVPVLNSNISVLIEICKENAIYFENNSIESLKKSIVKFVNNKEKSRGKRSDELLNLYSWEKQAIKMLGIICS